MTPERVSAGLLALVHEQAPSGMILLAGGGSFACAYITMTQGIHISDDEDTATLLCDRLAEVQDQSMQSTPKTGWDQSRQELANAMRSVLPNEE